MYLTKHPCFECAKLIANSGLTKLHVSDERPEMKAKHVETYRFLQEECGIEVIFSQRELGKVLNLTTEIAP